MGSSHRSGTVWDLESGEEMIQCTLGYEIKPLALAPDGQWMAYKHKGNTVRLWWPHMGVTEVLREAGSRDESYFYLLATSGGDGNTLVLAPRHHGAKAQLELWTVTGDVSTHELDDPAEICALVTTPDGQHLIVGRSDGVIEIRNGGDGTLRSNFSASSSGIDALAVSPSGQLLAVGSGQTLRIWDLQAHKEVARFCTRRLVSYAVMTSDHRIVCSDVGWIYDLQLEMPGGEGALEA